MSQLLEYPRHNLAFVVAVAICAVLFVLSRDPLATSSRTRRELAKKFKFERRDLPRPTGELRTVRTAAPSMARMQQWISALSASAALCDLDGDGLPDDLVYVETRTEQLMVTPVPGTTQRYAPFALVSLGFDRKSAGPAGALVTDVNDDGWPDIVVVFASRAPLLYLRKPPAAGATGLSAADFSVSEILEGPDAKLGWTTTAAIVSDLDGDGHPDLLLGNYFPDENNIYDPAETRLQEVHNNNGWACNGGGIHFLLWKRPTPEHPSWFREVKNILPERVLRGWTIALGCQDLDGDLRPDIYMGNDLGPDRLLHNLSTPGNLKFEVLDGRPSLTIPGSFVMGHDKYKGMACDFADVNGDGIPDIFVSNVASEYALQESHFLWVSRATGPGIREGVAPYEQESEKYGVSRGGWGWDAKFESFANQITPDLMQTRGFVKGKVNRWPEMQSLASYNSAYLKDPRNWPTFNPGMDIAGQDRDALYTMGPEGRYIDVGVEAGLDEAMVSRGISTADIDGDGRIDFAIANQWEPNYLYWNRSPDPGHWLGLRLMLPRRGAEGASPFAVLPGRPPLRGRPAYGALATVHLPDGRTLRREVDGGNGHCSKRSPELHFGLGKLSPMPRQLEVTLRWRGLDGKVAAPKTITVPVDGWHTVVLGEGATGEVTR